MDANARIFLRPIGSPAALGLSGLVVASLVSSGLELGWLADTERHAVALALLGFSFPLQLIASLFAFAARDGAVGTALGVLSGAWLVNGLVFLTSLPSTTTGALGLVLIAVAGLLGASAAAVATTNRLPAAVFATASLRFALTGIYELSGTELWQDAAGVVGLALVALAGFAMATTVMRDAAAKPLPDEPGVRARL